MESLVIGVVLGVLAALVAVFLPSLLIIDIVSYKMETVVKVIAAVLFVAVIVGGGILGCTIERHASRQYVETYTVEKQTIEASLHNEALSGFERVELVKQAAEANKELAGYQYDCKQWYGFNMDDRILELSFIDLANAGED